MTFCRQDFLLPLNSLIKPLSHSAFHKIVTVLWWFSKTENNFAISRQNFSFLHNCIPFHLPSLPISGMSNFSSCCWLHFQGLTSYEGKSTTFSPLRPGFLFSSSPLLRKHLEVDYSATVSKCLPFHRSHDLNGGHKEIGKGDGLVKFIILDS